MRTDLAETHRPSPARPPRKRETTRLLIVTSDEPGDALRLLPIAQAARSAGFDVQIALLLRSQTPPQDPALSLLAGSGVTVLRIDPPPSAGLLGIFNQYRAVGQIVAKVAPHMIHAVGLRAAVIAGAIARLRRLPILHSVPPLAGRLQRGSSTGWGRRAALGLALGLVFGNRRAHVHVTMPEDRAALVALRALDPRRSFLSRGLGVDLRVFHPRSAMEARPEGSPILALPPPDILGKGRLLQLIAAIRKIKACGVNVRFVLIGGQNDEEMSQETQEAMRLWQNEGLLEWWELADNLAESLRRVDAFCLPVPPGRSDVLGLLIAAAATGLPLIATDCAPFRDVIRHDLNGLLIPLDDNAALEAACARLMGDTAFRLQAGHRSREIAAAEFALDTSMTAVLTMYQAALTPPSSTRPVARQNV